MRLLADASVNTNVMSFSPFQSFADFWTEFFGLDPSHGFGAAFHFFVYDFPKVTFLIAAISFAMGMLRASLPVTSMRYWLSKSNLRILGYPIASLFGALTPFCSCSSVPLFIGFVEAGIPLGVTFAFLITSPLVNEIVVALFIASFGLEVTLLYVVAGLSIGIFGGLAIHAVGVENWLTPFAQSLRETASTTPPFSPDPAHTTTAHAAPTDAVNSATRSFSPSTPSPLACGCSAPAPAQTACGCSSSDSKACCAKPIDPSSWRGRVAFGAHESRSITLKVLPYLGIALLLGAAIHGYVPENFFAQFFAGGDWWGVPAATLIGLPLYASANGTVPILETLVDKGVPFGTAIAFILSAVGVSLPELIILKRVMTIRLLVLFTAVVSSGVILVGFIFNALHYVR